MSLVMSPALNNLQQRCNPGVAEGVIIAPSSKSMMQRAVGAATQVKGETVILHPSFSNDGHAALQVAAALGSSVKIEHDKVVIVGGGAPTGEALNCGESGYSMRMFCAIASTYSQDLTLIAHGSLTKRPVSMIEAPLQQCGVVVKTTAGFPPVTVHGPMRGGEIVVDGSASSQFLSGLLMALPLCAHDSIVKTVNLKSKPYILMTLELLSDFGIDVEYSEDLSFFKIAGNQAYRPITYTVEGDWSGASFPLVAGAIAGRVEVKNLRLNSKQADKAILDAIKLAGANIEVAGDSLTIEHRPLSGFTFDATDCPDLFPPLVALAACCNGVTTIKGAKRLADKESDRATALTKEFGKMGISIVVNGDDMHITGGKLRGAVVDSHNDHRIAMASGIAALRADGAVTINQPDCVAKSYTEFFTDLNSLRR